MIEIIGKNGAGKSTVANYLYEHGFKRNVGYTTRQIRDNEINHIDYHFISEEEFKRKIEAKEFIEYKKRKDNYYGISKLNISEDSIIISGDSKKIEDATGFKVIKYYMDTDIRKRYERVLLRNESNMNNFIRFHSENFSYLEDFDALFIDNNKEDILFEFINSIANGSLKNQLISNRKFLINKVSNYDVNDFIKLNDPLLLTLSYEEYLLRTLFLKYNNNSTKEMMEDYYYLMNEFLVGMGIKNVRSKDGINCIINEEKYVLDYKLKERVCLK